MIQLLFFLFFCLIYDCLENDINTIMNSLLYSHVAFSSAYMNAQGVKSTARE